MIAYVTAEVCQHLFTVATTTCETLESLYFESQELAEKPGCATAGALKTSIDGGFADSKEHLIALGGLMNELATDLLTRQQQCFDYTTEYYAHEGRIEAWDARRLAAELNNEEFDEPHPGPYPDPPFVGALPSPRVYAV